MDLIILLIWVSVVVFSPLAFIVFAYGNYVKENKFWQAVGSFIIAMIIHILITTVSGFFVFVFAFSLAHSATGVLDLKGKVFYAGINLVFLLVSWLSCSLIRGQIIKVWVLPSFGFGKMPSIFNYK